VTAYGLNQLDLDNNMWPIFVTQMLQNAMLLKNRYIEMNINFHLEKNNQHFSVTAFPKIVRYKDNIDDLSEKLLLLENVDF